MNKFLIIISLMLFSCGGMEDEKEYVSSPHNGCSFQFAGVNRNLGMRGTLVKNDDCCANDGFQVEIVFTSNINSTYPGDISVTAFGEFQEVYATNYLLPFTTIGYTWLTTITIPEGTKDFYVGAFTENCGHQFFNFTVGD